MSTTEPSIAPTVTPFPIAPTTPVPDAQGIYGLLFDCIQDNAEYRQLFDQNDLDNLKRDGIAIMAFLHVNNRFLVYEDLTVEEMTERELALCTNAAVSPPNPTATPPPAPVPSPTATPTPIPMLGIAPTPTPMPTPTATPTTTPVPTLDSLYNTAKTRWLVHHYPMQARQIQELVWVQDGLSTLERATIDEFIVMADVEIAALEAALASPWLQDGLSDLEAEVIDYLEYFAEYHNYGSALLSMPFLRTIEAADAAALNELGWLGWTSEDTFLDAMAKPMFDDGITDQWAMVLSTVTSIANTADPELLDDLLSPSKVSVESSQIQLPFTGTTNLAIIRVDVEGSDQSMGLLADVVTELDFIMATSLPRAYVGVLSADGGWFGHSAGTHIAIDPKYDENPQTGFGLRHLFMHEVGHYFWRGNRAWIDEGIANTLSDLFELKTTGRNTYLERNFDGCDKTIEDLDVESSNSGICHYHLGTPLFMELSWELGEARFHEALRKLYALSLSDGKADVGHVRKVFGDVAENADAVESIIDRWYYGHSAEN